MKEAAAEAQAETEAAHKKIFAEIRILAADRSQQFRHSATAHTSKITQ